MTAILVTGGAGFVGSHVAERLLAEEDDRLVVVDNFNGYYDPQRKLIRSMINGSRRRRIAEGSGTTVTDINRLMKQFLEMKKMMQRVSKLGVRSLMSQVPNPFH